MNPFSGMTEEQVKAIHPTAIVRFITTESDLYTGMLNCEIEIEGKSYRGGAPDRNGAIKNAYWSVKEYYENPKENVPNESMFWSSTYPHGKCRLKSNGIDLSNKTGYALHPLFREFIDKGYSPREISHIIMLECLTIELANVIA